mgnify:CR=1 FL=1
MTTCFVKDLENRYLFVNETIEQACQSVGRRRKDVTLVVVTKRRTPLLVASLVSLGVKDIGENYVQETIDKQAALGDVSENFRWHLIGPLQRRKAKYIPAHFSMMHSADRIEVLQKLDTVFSERKQKFPVLLQVNVSGEESKSGWSLPEGKVTPEFLGQIDVIMQMKSLDVIGLMTMPPFSSNAENSRKFYVQVRKLQEKLNKHMDNEVFSQLSMGTSFDYAVAIQEGATYVRIGEAILGTRD